jgi:hypothetical protein
MTTQKKEKRYPALEARKERIRKNPTLEAQKERMRRQKLDKSSLKPKKKRKTSRSRHPYPALEKRLNLGIRSEQNDYDYINVLVRQSKSTDPKKRQEAIEALKFLNNFTEGYINADFRNEEVKELFKDHPEIRKEAYKRNNYRNYDISSRARTRGLLQSYNEFMDNIGDSVTEYEDLLNIFNDGEYTSNKGGSTSDK